MKKHKRVGLVLGVIVVAIGLGLLIRYRWSQTSDEINRARLNQLIEQKSIVTATVTPTPYAGIYTVEGTSKPGTKPGRFSITTHLEEAQVRAILDGVDSKIDVPGRSGNKGQWANIICSLVISGLVVFLVAHQ